MMAIGIVSLSYGKRATEPSPANSTLAYLTDTLYAKLQEAGDDPVMAVQWEIALGMKYRPQVIVTQAQATGVNRNGTPYLDSQDVLDGAFELFRSANVDEVAVVANSFLHKPITELMVKKAGFKILKHKSSKIIFDNHPLQLQWWCKGPIRFTTYLAIQSIGKVARRNFHGIGEKHP